jgi:signal transduction histidine kinase
MAVSTAGDGAQALAVLAADPAVTVVLMTGHGAIEDAAQAVRAGAFDFQRKPMELDELVIVLTRAHARALARREAHALRIAEMERLRADYAALQVRLAKMETPLALTGETPPELARILSHELRTPLIPIIALPDMLDAQASLPPGALNAYLRDVHQAGTRLLQISENLIEFLASLDARCRPAAQAAGVTLTIGEIAAGEVETNEPHLIGALARLLTNAVAATPPSGRVDLAARAEGRSSVAFSVRDRGHGMTAEELDVAKLPFRQRDMSLTRRGDGLGLPLANRAAERLGERLEIESAPGAGTTARIALPRRHGNGRAS